MDELINLTPGEIRLLVLPRTLYHPLFVGVAHLAVTNTIRLLDCGGVYDPTVVARAAHGRKEITDRVLSQRAFNCFDVAKLIQTIPVAAGKVLVLDLLTYFYESSIAMSTLNYIAYSSLRRFENLARKSAIVITVEEPVDLSATVARRLFRDVRSIASQTFVFEELPPPERQLGFQWK